MQQIIVRKSAQIRAITSQFSPAWQGYFFSLPTQTGSCSSKRRPKNSECCLLVTRREGAGLSRGRGPWAPAEVTGLQSSAPEPREPCSSHSIPPGSPQIQGYCGEQGNEEVLQQGKPKDVSDMAWAGRRDLQGASRPQLLRSSACFTTFSACFWLAVGCKTGL